VKKVNVSQPTERVECIQKGSIITVNTEVVLAVMNTEAKKCFIHSVTVVTKFTENCILVNILLEASLITLLSYSKRCYSRKYKDWIKEGRADKFQTPIYGVNSGNLSCYGRV
jgi:hypothetical protein